jgi:hypothetical protein
MTGKRLRISSLWMLVALGCAPATPAESPPAASPAPASAPAPTAAPAPPAPAEPPPAPAAAAAKPVNTTPAESLLHPEYARTLARLAYQWGYPMVNMMNRRNIIGAAPRPGLLNGLLPVAPRGHLSMLHDYIDPAERAVACPNQDVVYGQAFFDLDKKPVIMQVPDFGDRFWIYAIYDNRTEQVGKLGKPYGSKPGFYALVGPNYKGKVPDGLAGVITSPTDLGMLVPRVFMNDTAEDRKAIQPIINQIAAYPFEEFTGTFKTTVWKDSPNIEGPKDTGGETKWVKPETFFDVFPLVLDAVPPQPGEEALYGQFRALLEASKKDPAIKAMMVKTAEELDKSMIPQFKEWKYNGVPAGNGWNRSKHNAEWGLDLYNRLGTSKSNILDNRPTETQYFYTDNDKDGKQLTGAGTYAVTFAKGELPPVQGFWSLTLYNEEHFFNPNPLKRYSLGTKNSTLKYNADGSLTLYAGNKSPGPDKESNWLPGPTGKFSLYLRAYWGKAGITDGTWKPPVIIKQ